MTAYSRLSIIPILVVALLISVLTQATLAESGIWSTATFPNGERYEGEWRELPGGFQPHGNGIYTWPNGEQHEGEFRNGKAHGNGIRTFPSGERYEGEFRNGKQHGNGINTWPNGERHEGEFRNGKAHGYGIRTWPSGRYEGEYRNGKKHGRGIHIAPNGDRYEGEIRNAKFHGKGVYTWPNGDYYEGEFRNDKAHGQGTKYFADGTRKQGEWREWKYVTKKKTERIKKARATAQKQQSERQLLAARVSCEKWNTATFFKHAGEKDVSRCLEEGADPNTRNKYGETPLHMIAKFSKAPTVVAALAKAGADLKAQDKKGRTPLHTAAVFSKTPEVVTALINAGADLNTRDKRGRTPLEFAEIFSETPAVVAALKKALAAKKIRVSTRKRQIERRTGKARVTCEKWNTPAFFKDASLADLARCLKTKNPNARNKNGRTPLHYAAQGKEPALVTTLVKAGAKVNARDERGGWTPLHLAAWFGKTPAVVTALLEAGADPAARDKAGKTPWDYAKANAALKGSIPSFISRK